VTPYVGAGLGISVVRMSGGLEYRKTVNGELYTADLRHTADAGGVPHVWVDNNGDPITSWTDVAGVTQQGNPPVAFERQSWSRTGSQLKFNPAFALIAGFSFDVSDQLKGEVSWRYLNSGSLKSLGTVAMPNSVSSQLNSQQITVSLRYMID
jgi:opacity protein-like surface antigen